MMRFISLLCMALAIAGIARADTFATPEGCAAFLTVQASNCVVEHYWTCEKDASGEHWSGEVSRQGLIYVGKIDQEARWLESYFLRSNRKETLGSSMADPASLTELLETGLDTYDFNMQTSTGVDRVVGFDRIVERDVVIDGEPLHRTEFSIRKTNAAGEVNYEAEGSEYVSAKHRRFFSGYGEVTGPETPWRYNNAPVEFIYPQDAGFLSNIPKYGCDVQTARMPLQ